MATQSKKFPQLPGHSEIQAAALPWIQTQMDHVGTYTSEGLRDYLSGYFKADLTLTLDNGRIAFYNYVDWFLANMTSGKYHEKIKAKTYCLNPIGYELAKKVCA